MRNTATHFGFGTSHLTDFKRNDVQQKGKVVKAVEVNRKQAVISDEDDDVDLVEDHYLIGNKMTTGGGATIQAPPGMKWKNIREWCLQNNSKVKAKRVKGSEKLKIGK